jgi:hypothetical protein
MVSIMRVGARPPRGGASSKSTCWAFEVKLWETLGVSSTRTLQWHSRGSTRSPLYHGMST